ncbi:MAG: hypothetical protein JWO37_605 [Acidimicrobiales bacterium]|nr:hypothetical protein [Acidimicrobiales bacterium]
MEFEPWTCPKCGRENEGYRGFCGACTYQRPLEERFAPAGACGAPSASAPATGPPSEPAAPRGAGPSLPALAVAWVVLVVGLSVVAVLVGNRHAGPSYPKAWDVRVQGIAQFVENERALKFDHPVRVDFVPVAVFKTRVGEGKAPTKKEQQDLEDQVAELRAVGLVSGNFDLRALQRKLVQGAVVGYYDPDTKRITVRGDQMTPDVRVTLAHELTHALQDQHYDLRLFRNDRTGQADAYRALYEADAVRIEDIYTHDQLSATDLQELQTARQQDQKDADLGSIPAILTDSFSFPYVVGPYFVKALTDAGGNARVDQAFARPPASDAEIVSPEVYIDGFAPDEVAPPSLGAGESALGKPSPSGQVALLEVLGARLGYVRGWDAVRGWKGDSSISYRKSGKVCVVDAVALGSDADRDRFETGARAWAAGMPAAEITRRGDNVVLRSCDPGASFKAPTQDPSPFDTLALRAGFAQGIREAGHFDGAVASCIADRVIAVLGPPAIAKLNDSSPDAQVLAVARVAVGAAAAPCKANPADRVP